MYKGKTVYHNYLLNYPDLMLFLFIETLCCSLAQASLELVILLFILTSGINIILTSVKRKNLAHWYNSGNFCRVVNVYQKPYV
jgi:uncharacterized membrane protein